MHLNEDRVKKLGQRIAAEGLIERHRKRTRDEYRTIFGVETTPETVRENLDLIFERVIQARATPLPADRYRELAEQDVLKEALSQPSHDAAFQLLYGTDDIGQKIANEMLRHVVDLFGINSEWRDDLDVALDTNVVQALVKTGAIELDETENNREAGDIVNMRPDANPTTKISYSSVQEAFADAAEEHDFAPIVFDELWLEHREFISDPLLRERSKFGDLIVA